MSNNLENERTITAGKMYPIDLAPQKITIVKSVSNSEVKMTHLITSQPKTTGAGQIITHAGSMGLIRPASQILAPGVGSQQQMIVSGSPILQGTSIVSQGSQLIGPSSQIITPQLLSGQILQPATQIISQGTQLSVQVSSSSPSVQVSVASPVSGTQVLNVGGLGGQLVTGTGNLVVSSSVRTLPQSVRVLPPLPHHNTRPVLQSSTPHTGGVLVSKAVAAHAPVSKGPTSHVPRGLAAGASLALRPAQPAQAQGWSGGRARGALVYNARSPAPRPAAPRAPVPPPQVTSPQHSTIVTLPNTTVLASSLSSGVIAGAVRAPAARPLPLLQRNYQPAKVVGVGVGNSAPPQLYYEVPRPQPRLQPLATQPLATQPQSQPLPLQQSHPPPQSQHSQPQPPLSQPQPLLSQQQPLLSQPQPQLSQPHLQPQSLVTTVSVVNAVQALTEIRGATQMQLQPAIAPRPSILRKRDAEGSPTKQAALFGRTGWEDVPAGGSGSGGSTTMSASSSPGPETEPEPHPDLSPRKKPRKQMLANDMRACELPAEPAPPAHPAPLVPPAHPAPPAPAPPAPAPPATAPPVELKPPPKRPLLSSSYVCGWRATALHFARPADVRRREPRARDILAIASQRHVLGTAEGWKVHHLTAQMDDLVSLEADVGSQLSGVLRAIEALPNRASAALQPHSHTLLELLKGNIQRSKIVCEGIQEAREDILRVFTHRNFVSDILTRQADKRSFRKHRSQS